MTPTIIVRLSEAVETFLSLYQSFSPQPSSSFIIERYRKAFPSAKAPNPRMRRWSRRWRSNQVECLPLAGRQGLSEELATLNPGHVIVVAPAKAWHLLNDSTKRDASDIAETICAGEYKASLLLNGKLPADECEELRKRLKAADVFQGAAARHLFAAHLRRAVRPGVNDDTETKPRIWSGSLTIKGSDHMMSGLEIFDPSGGDLHKHGMEGLQTTPGVVIESASRVPEGGAMLAACGALELRLGIGCNSSAATFWEEWINLRHALRITIGSVQFWCFWTRTNGDLCCRVLRIPEIDAAMTDALDVSRFRRQQLGFECVLLKPVPEVLARLPEVRTERISPRQKSEDDVATGQTEQSYDNEEEKKRDVAEALALMEETRDCIIEAAPLDNRKRVVADAIQPEAAVQEFGLATECFKEFGSDHSPSTAPGPSPCRFASRGLEAGEAPASALELKPDSAGLLTQACGEDVTYALAPERKSEMTKTPEPVAKSDITCVVPAKPSSNMIDLHAPQGEPEVPNRVPGKKRNRPREKEDGSVLSASTMTTNVASVGRQSPNLRREWKRRRFERPQEKGSIQPLRAKKNGVKTAAIAQRRGLPRGNSEHGMRWRRGDVRKLQRSSRTYVEEITKQVLGSLQQAPPFFDYTAAVPGEGGASKDRKAQSLGRENETLRQDLSTGGGQLPLPGTHGVEYCCDGDGRDRKLAHVEQYFGKLGLEFASKQGKVTQKQARRLQDEIRLLNKEGMGRRIQGNSLSPEKVDLRDEEESTDICPDDQVTPLTPLPQPANVRSLAHVKTGRGGAMAGCGSSSAPEHSEMKSARDLTQEALKTSQSELKTTWEANPQPDHNTGTQGHGETQPSFKKQLLTLVECSDEKDRSEKCAILTDVLIHQLELMDKDKKKRLIHRVVDALT